MVQAKLMDLGDGTQVWVETIDVEPDGVELVSAGDEHQARVQQALDMIKPAAAALHRSLQEINRPKTVELEFGVGISGQIGAFIAAASTSMHFKVKLSWENTDPADGAAATGAGAEAAPPNSDATP